MPLPQPLNTSTLQYLRTIRSYPMLTFAEETTLAVRLRDHQDRGAATRLTRSHMPLVVKTAMDLQGYGLPIDDLISEGTIGLMRAVDKFDPDRGLRLSTYARWWIRAAIQEYVLRNWSLVRMGTTAAQKKLFFALRRMKAQIGAIAPGDMTPEHVQTIAHALSVDAEDVVSMNRRLSGPEHSLNASLGTNGPLEWQDVLPDTGANQEETLATAQQASQRQIMLAGAVNSLAPREQHIIADRHLREQPATLEDLAQHYGLSSERIRQIEKRAVEKIGVSVLRQMADQRLRRQMNRAGCRAGSIAGAPPPLFRKEDACEPIRPPSCPPPHLSVAWQASP